jgi:hypothetical protein
MMKTAAPPEKFGHGSFGPRRRLSIAIIGKVGGLAINAYDRHASFFRIALHHATFVAMIAASRIGLLVFSPVP